MKSSFSIKTLFGSQPDRVTTIELTQYGTDIIRRNCQEKLVEEVEKTKNCFIGRMKSSKWYEQFGFILRECSTYFETRLKFIPLQNKDETKFVVLPIVTNAECNVVTLGIGNDIQAEKRLQKLVPSCRFFGADPIEQSGKVYREIGTYYQTAVGVKDGSHIASVLVNGSYSKQIVTYTSIENFLKQIKIKHVDYLIMDAEGAEYGLLPLLEKTKVAHDLIICQLNLELHMPVEQYNMTNDRLNKIFVDFIFNSRLIPIFGRERSVWIDVLSPNCRDKYLPKDLC